MLNIGILIWKDAEVLDFCGPFEVFRAASSMAEDEIDVFIVSETTDPVDAQGMSINPRYSFETCPKLDVLLIPGGASSKMKDNKVYTDWIASQFDDLSNLLTVCTGALLAAKASLLENKEITTHHIAYDTLEDLVPSAKVLREVRYTDNGKVMMSGGISAGIDMSLYFIKNNFGLELAEKICVYMEYDWRYREKNLEFKIKN